MQGVTLPMDRAMALWSERGEHQAEMLQLGWPDSELCEGFTRKQGRDFSEETLKLHSGYFESCKVVGDLGPDMDGGLDDAFCVLHSSLHCCLM